MQPTAGPAEATRQAICPGPAGEPGMTVKLPVDQFSACGPVVETVRRHVSADNALTVAQEIK